MQMFVAYYNSKRQTTYRSRYSSWGMSPASKRGPKTKRSKVSHSTRLPSFHFLYFGRFLSCREQWLKWLHSRFRMGLSNEACARRGNKLVCSSVVGAPGAPPAVCAVMRTAAGCDGSGDQDKQSSEGGGGEGGQKMERCELQHSLPWW